MIQRILFHSNSFKSLFLKLPEEIFFIILSLSSFQTFSSKARHSSINFCQLNFERYSFLHESDSSAAAEIENKTSAANPSE